MASRKEARERGLPSLNQARAERQRALIAGKVRMPGVPLHFWLWAFVGITAFGIVYWRISQGELESARSRVLAKQRAMSVALGPKLFPFRDRAEGWAGELSADWRGDFVSPAADLARLRISPSVYLRLRLANARSAAQVRTAAKGSLRDGFTSCLFVANRSSDPTQGTACRTIGDCASGLLCNEWNVCARPEQPYNLRLAYRTLRVLSPEWTEEVHEAKSELALTGYDRDLDNVARRDVPVTVELLSRSKFFTLVLDEDPEGGVPEEIPDAGESSEERVQRAEHWARVGIWDLTTGQPVLRLRTQAAGELLLTGRQDRGDLTNVAAQQRQANSCQLAISVREAFPAREPAAPTGVPGP